MKLTRMTGQLEAYLFQNQGLSYKVVVKAITRPTLILLRADFDCVKHQESAWSHWEKEPNNISTSKVRYEC